MVALGLQETAIRGQLNHAMAMAEKQCPKYKESNMFWKRADQLQERHQETIDAIMNHTKAVQESHQEEEKVDLSDFLLQESPAKKRSYDDMLEEDEDNAVEVLDFSEDNETPAQPTSLCAKVEKMNTATMKAVVSNRKKKRRTIG
jgi:hypothetical protein